MIALNEKVKSAPSDNPYCYRGQLQFAYVIKIAANELVLLPLTWLFQAMMQGTRSSVEVLYSMVTLEAVEKQLKKIHFNHLAWGRSEARELPHILMPEEEIFEVVNGIYEGGFALLVATNVRALLIDKKPMKFLTVEDLRFDMINEIDYSHRLFGARISISTGSKNLKFTSFNQPRLRKLITHIQHCMAETKIKQSEHQEDQKSHLEQINKRLQTYLLAQHQHQQKLQQQLEQTQAQNQQSAPRQPAMDSDLVDYLFAQSLLAQHQADNPQAAVPDINPVAQQVVAAQAIPPTIPHQDPSNPPASQHMSELYAEGMQEIFGKQRPQQSPVPVTTPQAAALNQTVQQPAEPVTQHPLEINPLRIAYSKLPMALRNRRFGRPSFHAHSQQEPLPPQPTVVAEV